jgi:hypothetical protein
VPDTRRKEKPALSLILFSFAGLECLQSELGMFFLLRAFICIAVIIAIADGLTPARLWSDSRQSVTHAASSLGGRFRDYCEHNVARCMAILDAGAPGPTVETSRRAQGTEGRRRPAPAGDTPQLR